jgi:hypothetical protein
VSGRVWRIVAPCGTVGHTSQPSPGAHESLAPTHLISKGQATDRPKSDATPTRGAAPDLSWALSALNDISATPFWLDSPDAPPPAAPLTVSTTCDLVVVGAGYSGLWTAVHRIDASGTPVVLPTCSDGREASQAFLGGRLRQPGEHALREIHGAHGMTGACQRQRQCARAAANVEDAIARQEPHVLDEGRCIGSIGGRRKVVSASVPVRGVARELAPRLHLYPLRIPVRVDQRHYQPSVRRLRRKPRQSPRSASVSSG